MKPPAAILSHLASASEAKLLHEKTGWCLCVNITWGVRAPEAGTIRYLNWGLLTQKNSRWKAYKIMKSNKIDNPNHVWYLNDLLRRQPGFSGVNSRHRDYMPQATVKVPLLPSGLRYKMLTLHFKLEVKHWEVLPNLNVCWKHHTKFGRHISLQNPFGAWDVHCARTTFVALLAPFKRTTLIYIYIYCTCYTYHPNNIFAV